MFSQGYVPLPSNNSIQPKAKYNCPLFHQIDPQNTMQSLVVNLAAAFFVFDVAAAFIIRDMRNSANKEQVKMKQLIRDKETHKHKYISQAAKQKYISDVPKQKYISNAPKPKYTSGDQGQSKKNKTTTVADQVAGPSIMKKKTNPFELGYEEVQTNWNNEGRHWHMGQALGINNFEDYWAYLLGGRAKSKGGEKHVRFDTPYSMAVTPIVDDSGRTTHLIVNKIFCCRDHGAMTMEYTYTLPTEKHRDSVEEWEKQLVAIKKETGDPMTMTVGNLIDTIGMMPEEMMAALNRWVRKAPFFKVYSDA